MSCRIAAALALALLLAGPPASRGQEPTLNPHTREACLHCHKDGVAGPPGAFGSWLSVNVERFGAKSTVVPFSTLPFL